VHGEESLRRAEHAGADYALFGPIWAPGWKLAEARGLTSLGRLARSSRIPLLAIGGVTPDRVAECLAHGAHGVAVVSGVFHAPAPDDALRDYLRPFLATAERG
jgi:thiamine-phosphate pyrophosphorylase